MALVFAIKLLFFIFKVFKKIVFIVSGRIFKKHFFYVIFINYDTSMS